MIITAIVVAAGRGTRMGTGVPKALLSLAGSSLLSRAVTAFLGHPRVDRVVAVVGDPDVAAAALPAGVGPRLTLVRGGAERQESVWLGLQAAADAGLVLVHDAARALVPAAVIDAVIDAAAREGAAIPVLEVADTVKQVAGDGSISATLPRGELRLAQTPQGFRADLLRSALERAARDGISGTDDAALVERTGHRVVTVAGSPRNFKITTPSDLRLAAALLRLDDAGETGDG